MKATTIVDTTGVEIRDGERHEFPRPAGETVNHPDAWKLVAMGIAKPADEECLARCDQWAAKRGKPLEQCMAEAFHAHVRTRAGIHPEDFEKFDRGEITGYNPDGSFKPGPNAKSENHGGIIVVDE